MKRVLFCHPKPQTLNTVNGYFDSQIELLEEWLVLHGRESETEELRPWRIEVMTSMSRHRVEAAYRTLERGMPQFQEGYDDTLRTLEDAQVSINRFILPFTVRHHEISSWGSRLHP